MHLPGRALGKNLLQGLVFGFRASALGFQMYGRSLEIHVGHTQSPETESRTVRHDHPQPKPGTTHQEPCPADIFLSETSKCLLDALDMVHLVVGAQSTRHRERERERERERDRERETARERERKRREREREREREERRERESGRESQAIIRQPS